jgi:hypothetical protein
LQSDLKLERASSEKVSAVPRRQSARPYRACCNGSVWDTPALPSSAEPDRARPERRSRRDSDRKNRGLRPLERYTRTRFPVAGTCYRVIKFPPVEQDVLPGIVTFRLSKRARCDRFQLSLDLSANSGLAFSARASLAFSAVIAGPKASSQSQG